MTPPKAWLLAWWLLLGAGSTVPARAADPADVLFDLRAAQQKLRHADPAVRIRGAESLGALGPDAAPAAAELVAALGDLSLGVAAAAETALPRLGPAAIPEVVEGLSDPDEIVRLRAVEVLAQLGPDAAPAIPALAAALEDSEAIVRERAAAALGAIGPSAATASLALVRRVENDVDQRVRRACLEALSRIELELDGVPKVDRREPGSDEIVQLRGAEIAWRLEASPEALGRILAAQVSPERSVQTAGEFAWRRVVARNREQRTAPGSDDAVDPLLEALTELRAHLDPRVQAGVALALDAQWPGEDVTLQALAGLVVGAQPETVRRRAVLRLRDGRGAKATVVPEMIRALSDESLIVRAAAAEVLAQCGREAEPARDKLERLLVEDPEAYVREAAEQALYEIGTAD
jgi:HEAT repeat protein